MNKAKLTAGRIAAFTCPADKHQAFLWDTDVPGLALRATPGGTKAYIFQSRLAGKSLRMTIGDMRSWMLEAARQKARELQTIVDGGRDPRQVKAERTADDAKKRQQDTQDSAPALHAWTEYINAHPKWSARYIADHHSMADAGGKPFTRGRRKEGQTKTEAGILRPLLEQPLRDITRDQVGNWLATETPRRATRARLALSMLKAFLNWCSDQPAYRSQIHSDACTRMKQALPQPKAKEDCLQREQLKPWFEAVRALPNRVISAYLQITLLTGSRREETAGLRWEDVDFAWDGLTIRDKIEGQRVIPLTPYVKALLLDLRDLNQQPLVARAEGKDNTWQPSPWVFPSRTAASGRLQEPRIAHNKALAAAGLPPLTTHGLRRSFGTLAEWVEAPAGVVAQIMGHKPSAIAEKHYRRRPLDLLRMWHVKIEEWALEQTR